MKDLPSNIRSQLFYFPVMIGPWDIFYGGEDGMLRNDFHETLELRGDGTFRWEPLPIWAKPDGQWGLLKDARWVRMKGENQPVNVGGEALCFEKSDGSFRCNYLVLVDLNRDGHWHMNWTRTRGDAVIFVDRLWSAFRPKDWQPPQTERVLEDVDYG